MRHGEAVAFVVDSYDDDKADISPLWVARWYRQLAQRRLTVLGDPWETDEDEA